MWYAMIYLIEADLHSTYCHLHTALMWLKLWKRCALKHKYNTGC